MRRKIWKKLLAAGCAVSLLATAPGTTVLANQLQEDKVIETEAEVPEQVAESAETVQVDAINEFDFKSTEAAESVPDIQIEEPVEEPMIENSEAEEISTESIDDEKETLVGDSLDGYYMYSDNGNMITIDAYTGANITAKSIIFGNLDRDLSSCGFVSGDITITIKYNGKAVGSFKYNPNPNANSEGLHPYRAFFLLLFRSWLLCYGRSLCLIHPGKHSCHNLLLSFPHHIQTGFLTDSLPAR